MANQYLVDSPYSPFTIKNQFKAISNGKVYIGEVDKDPLNPSQQIQVYVVDETGSNVPVNQPIQLNAGGYLVYNGQVSKFITLEPYSMVVLNNVDAEMWRVDDISKVDPDNITASTIPTSSSGSVQDFIDAQFTTVAEMATGKFQVGQYVRLTDRSLKLFKVQSGGFLTGKGTIDAGNGNTAKIQYDSQLNLESLGLTSGSDITPFITEADSIAKFGDTITCSDISVVTLSTAHLEKDGVNWRLGATIDGAGHAGVQVVLKGKHITFLANHFTNSQFYDVLCAPESEDCKVNHTKSSNCKFTSFFDQGKNNSWFKLLSFDAGWDLASALGTENSNWSQCIAVRPKRHGFSSDPSTDGARYTDCITIDNGGYLNEGSDAFHSEASDLSDIDRQVTAFTRCKVIYTDNHRVLTDPTYIDFVRAFRSENVLRTNVKGLDIIAEPAIRAALLYKKIVLFGDSRQVGQSIVPSTVVDDLTLDFGILSLGDQIVTINNPKGAFLINKQGYAGSITLNNPDLDGSLATMTTAAFATAGTGLMISDVNILGKGSIKNYGSIFDRIASNCIVDTHLVDVTNPYNLELDITNPALSGKNLICKGRVSGAVNIFLKEAYNNYDAVTVEGVIFDGTVITLRQGFFSSSKWIGCDATAAIVSNSEVDGGGGKINLNVYARSQHDAIHSVVATAPTFVPYSFGSTARVTGGGFYSADGILATDWNIV